MLKRSTPPSVFHFTPSANLRRWGGIGLPILRPAGFLLLFCLLSLAGNEWGGQPVSAQEEPSPGKRQVDFALGLFQRGDFQAALTEFEVYLKNPEWTAERPVSLFFAAECHRRLNQPSKAANYYDLLLEFAPNSPYSPVARYRLAEIQIDSRKGQEALETLAPFETMEVPKELREGVLYSFALASSLAGQSEKALEYWGKVREEFPESESARRSLFGMGIETFRMERWEESAALLRDWIALPGAAENPAHPEALQRLAEAEIHLGSPEQALGSFISLSNSGAPPAVKQNALTEAARLASEQGKEEVFADLATRASAELTEPEPRMKWHLLAGNREYLKGNWAAAREHYQSAREWVAQTPAGTAQDLPNQIALRLAWCDVALKEWDKVLEHLAPVSEQTKTLDEYCYLMGEAYRQKNEWQTSFDWFAKISPEFKEWDLVKKGKADAAFRAGFWEEAELLYSLLSQEETEPEQRVFYLLRAAEANRKLENWTASAVLCASAAVITASGDLRERALYLSGWSHLQAQETREAVRQLRQLVSDFPRSPQMPNALYMLGQAHNRIGDRQAEVVALERLVTEYPDSSWTSDALLRLAGAYSFLDDREGILSSLRRFQSRFPDKPLNEDYSLWLADELVSAASFEEARITLDRLLARELKPEMEEEALLLSGQTWEGLEQWQQALETFERGLEKFPQGSDLLRYRLGAGRAAYYLGELATSWEHTRTALDWVSQNSAPDPAVEAQLYLLAGDLAFEEGDFDLAYRNYARPSILLNHPVWTPLALHKSALAKDRLGEFEAAKSLREELAADYPDFNPEAPQP
jgi:TolA-binding protein